MKNRIAEVLIEKNMKQIELARLLNVGRSRVSMWCSSSSTPNVQMLLKISDVLNVQLTELLAAKANLKENQSNGI
jgi:transcriptional regulator with XRE-family HTH domain